MWKSDTLDSSEENIILEIRKEIVCVLIGTKKYHYIKKEKEEKSFVSITTKGIFYRKKKEES